MPDLRQEIFTLLKDIIDDEWGPYDDDHYWPMVDEFMTQASIRREWALTRGAGQVVMSEAAARDKAERWPESFGVASRYVTQWSDE